MSILNFITQDQLDNLDEDHSAAFMELVNLAQRSLSDQLSRYRGNDEDDWREMQDLRHTFVNVIVAAAKNFEIEPFSSMEVPRVNDGVDFKQFQSDLDHYITQLVLGNSLRAKKDTVLILPASKDRIRNYIHGLRDCIEKSNMDEAKRSKLLDRLDDLEKELEKRRANIAMMAKIAFEVLAIPGGVWASYEIVGKMLTNISQVVEEARVEEQANKPLLSSKPTPALSAPRQPPKDNFEGAKYGGGFGGGFGDDLDDDVPF